MAWSVGFHSSFEREFDELDEEVQDEILALMGLRRVGAKGASTRT